MKKDNIKENEEENLLQTSEEKLTEIKEEVTAKKNHPCIKALLANVIDQVIILACSGIILLLFDFLIRRIGYMVAIPEQVLIIIYFILNCIYEPIMKKTKLKKTFAKKIFNLK